MSYVLPYAKELITKAEFQAEMKAIRQEMKALEERLRGEMKALEERLNSRIDKLNLKLNLLIVLMVLLVTFFNPMVTEIIKKWVLK